MVQWVYETVRSSGVGEQVLVATPDQEIARACEAFGAPWILTRSDHPSGTDRIAEVSETIVADIYVNVQGDEPLIAQQSIRAVANVFERQPDAEMASVYTVCAPEDEENPNVVKVVTGNNGQALYFSRWPIPYPRNPRQAPLKKHLGIYAYRRSVLKRFKSWTPGVLETTESLEQLRFLENGVSIYMAEGQDGGVSVDTPEQAELARAQLARVDNSK